VGVRVRRPFGAVFSIAHAGWVLSVWNLELGSVTLKINNQHTLVRPAPIFGADEVVAYASKSSG